MKMKSRLLSMTTAVMMTVSMLPANALQLTTASASSKKSNTNPTIDFNFQNNEVSTPEDTLLQIGADSLVYQTDMDKADWEELYNQFEWKQADHWSCKDIEENSLRKFLTSTDEDSKYICLTKDNFEESHKRLTYKTIEITTDKVLDLNGHTLEFSYDRNRNNDAWDRYQNDDPDTHLSTAFEITNGATLTIIDSSAWRQKDGSKNGTGGIKFYAYMIDPFKYKINYNTTRDLFHVDDGNLVIYGGTFQAGRIKHQVKSNFSIKKLITAIGSAIELGVNVAEYATGLNVALGEYDDELEYVAKKAALEAEASKTKKDQIMDDDHKEDDPSTNKRDGTNLNALTRSAEAKEGPGGKDDRDPTIGEKKDDKKDGENKSNDKKNAKDDSNTKIAEAQNKIVKQATGKDGIMGIVNSCFTLGQSIADMIGKDGSSRVTQSIKGTVVTVGNQGTFVAYGGTFKGYGSTPNVRNATIEIVVNPGTTGRNAFDKNKNIGGLAYIYGGTFEAYNGANVFNMVVPNYGTQYAFEYDSNDPDNPKKVILDKSETANMEVLYYENQKAIINGTEKTPVPINTANIQVRGGVFRCFYDLMNVAPKREGDKENFRKFPGTMGTINLGVESYNSDLIQDGRIQIVDRYGAGSLVLLDEQSKDEAGGEGLYHYRLYRGDTELRASSYLEVYPNTKLKTNTSHSMQLCTYDGTGKSTLSILPENEDNIRAPYTQTENYFDFRVDDPNNDRWSVMPNFRYAKTGEMDIYGDEIANSEVWYYPIPRQARNGEPIEDVGYKELVLKATAFKSIEIKDSLGHKFGEGFELADEFSSRDCTKDDLKLALKTSASSKREYVSYDYSRINSNLIFFTYKVYRVDPLTRENISESKESGIDEPLISVRYGSSMDDALRCKLPLKEVEAAIKERRKDQWEGFQQGEMYRIVLSVDQRIGINYTPSGFGDELLPAQCESSILFRCYAASEVMEDENNDIRKYNNFTPIQFDLKEVVDETSVTGRTYMAPIVNAGKTANVHIINGKAGMTDYRGDVKVFDIYYQWWEVEEDGTPIRIIAGTDNVYDKSMGARSEHDNVHWNVGNDKKTYVNSVDPNDPKASLYGENGLPKNQLDWDDKMLHMYTDTMTSKKKLTLDGTDNLYLGNNKIFETNTDSCYIPEDMAGKYLQVKVIALNPDWPMAYDPKQTFTSHIVKVEGDVKEITGEVQSEYTNGKNFAQYDQPAAISLSSIDGLYSNEKIKDVRFYVRGNVSSRPPIEFNDLNTKDISKIPSVKFPDDFYPKDYNLEKVRLGEYEYYAYIRTDKGRNYYTPRKTFSFEKQATDIKASNIPEEFKLSDIQNGKFAKGVGAFSVQPYGASFGWDFHNYTTTDADIATLDDYGNIHFGNKFGEATITVKSPTGKYVSTNVTVINDYSHFEIGVKPPVAGKEFDYTVTIPDNAPYHVKEVKWLKDSVSWNEGTVVAKDEKADYGHPYIIGVTLESNEFCTSNRTADYTLSALLPGGSTDVVNGESVDQAYDYTTGEYSQEFTFYYVYNAQIDPNADTIKEIHLDFPTSVPEGTYFDEWLDDCVSFYTNAPAEGFELKIRPTYGEDYYDIAYAYGYELREDIASFIKGVQTGLDVEIYVPADLKAKGYGIEEDLDIFINGKKTANVSCQSDGILLFQALDSITITDGTLNAGSPLYTLKEVYPVVNKTIDINDILQTNDPATSITMTDVHGAVDDVSEFISYNLSEETFTAIKESSNSFYIECTISCDKNHDGIPEFKRNETIYIPKLYATEDDVPEIQEPEVIKFTVTALAPDGTEAYSNDYEITEGERFAVPEIENALISEIIDSEGYHISGSKFLRYGASQLDTFYNEGESYTFKTVPADSICINAGADTVYAFINDEDGYPIGGINLSLDGIHYVNSDRLTGLTPDTKYILYYKQGIDGQVYTTEFTTPHEDYGVYIGRQIVTNKNIGDLEKDGWHYDPESKTLTLKDFNLKDIGAVASVDNISSIKEKTKAVISSQNELTVELIGNNTIEGCYSGYNLSLIYAEKDLTVKGRGNITLKTSDNAFRSKTGDIYLSGSGNQTFEECIAYNTDEGKVYYENGTIEIGNSRSLMPFFKRDILDISKKTHSLKITTTDAVGNKKTMSDEQFLEKIQDYFFTDGISIVPIHNDTEKYKEAAYLESGSCEEGAVYHYACECGHISDKTYTVEAHEHNLIHHAAKAADCCNGGWKAYDTCEDCGYTTFKAIPAKGHDMEHHDAITAFCTEEGSLEYWYCKKCKGIFINELGTYQIEEANLKVPAAGHELKHIAAVSATCTEDGCIEHWVCDKCGNVFADVQGLTALEADDITLPNTGHLWGEWILTKEPTVETEGEETHTCSACDEKETRTVAKLSVTNTTTTSTTTSTTTTSKPTTSSTSSTSKNSTTSTTTTTKTTSSTTSTTSTTTKTTSSTTSSSTTTKKPTTTSTTTTKTTSSTTSSSTTTKKPTTTSTTSTTTTTSTTSTTTTTMPFETVEDERVIGSWELYKYVDSQSGETNEINSNEVSYSFTFTDDFKCTVTYEDKVNGHSKVTQCLWTAAETETGGKDKILIVSTEDPNEKMIVDIKDDELSFGFLQLEDTIAYMKKKPEAKHGDINGDGKINPVDASLILVKFAELSAPDAETPSDELIKRFDINGDGRITAVDASLLLAYCANLAGDETLTLDAFLADKIKN